MNRYPGQDVEAGAVGMQRSHRVEAEYVVPLKWSEDEEAAEFGVYLRLLAEMVDITVVDGSAQSAFDRHAAAWGSFVRHLRPQPWPGRNGKVAGVVTGVLCARHETVVLADDDVRYTLEQLQAAVDRFARFRADVLRPQNYFDPLPWHAQWDTARTLLNRAFGTDYPGTFVLRRSAFLRMGGYDGDVLFENLQMIRTLIAAGGWELRAPDLYVARRPPTALRFLDQRVRQAYDDLAQPARLVLELSMLPAMSLLAARRPTALGLVVGAVTIAAESGRRRHGGARVFASSAALWAPLWLLERAVCVWLAALERARGGARYRGERLRHAASRPRRRPPLMPTADGHEDLTEGSAQLSPTALDLPTTKGVPAQRGSGAAAPGRSMPTERPMENAP